MESESKSARLRESRVREARVREAEREREEVVGRAVEAAERSATQVRRTHAAFWASSFGLAGLLRCGRAALLCRWSVLALFCG